jgi:hypothetical protein
MTTRSNAADCEAVRRNGADAGPVTAVRPRRLMVEDVMTRDVVTVAPTATFHQMTVPSTTVGTIAFDPIPLPRAVA